jgi:hypothetical protein
MLLASLYAPARIGRDDVILLGPSEHGAGLSQYEIEQRVALDGSEHLPDVGSGDGLSLYLAQLRQDVTLDQLRAKAPALVLFLGPLLYVAVVKVLKCVGDELCPPFGVRVLAIGHPPGQLAHPLSGLDDGDGIGCAQAVPPRLALNGVHKVPRP